MFFETGEREHYLWTEKHRPSTIDKYVGNEHFKSMLEGYIAEQDIPHLLLYGSAGTGKTTAAKIIINSIDCDSLMINASDENNVETVRTKIKNFASSVGFKPLKIIVLDECDYITPQAQAALRNLMEVFSKKTRFVLTANYKDRIIEPIISRTQPFEIIPPSRKGAAIHVAGILKSENVSFDPKDLALLVDAHYPDVRHIINAAQSHSKNGELKINKQEVIESDYKMKVIDILCSTRSAKDKFVAIRKTLADARIKDYAPMYRLLFDKVDEYSPNNISATILAIAEGHYKDAFVVDHEINMMATLINVLGYQK